MRVQLGLPIAFVAIVAAVSAVTASAEPPTGGGDEFAEVTLADAMSLLPPIVPLDDISGEQVLAGGRVVELTRAPDLENSLCVRSEGPTPDGRTTDVVRICLPTAGEVGLVAGLSVGATNNTLYFVTASEIDVSSPDCQIAHFSDAGTSVHVCVTVPRDSVEIRLSVNDTNLEVVLDAGPSFEELVQ